MYRYERFDLKICAKMRIIRAGFITATISTMILIFLIIATIAMRRFVITIVGITISADSYFYDKNRTAVVVVVAIIVNTIAIARMAITVTFIAIF